MEQRSCSSFDENFTEVEENDTNMRVSSPQSPVIGLTHSLASETSISLESSSSSNETNKPCRSGGNKKCKVTKKKSKKVSNTILFPTTYV